MPTVGPMLRNPRRAQIPAQAVPSWATQLTTLGFSFLIGKMGLLCAPSGRSEGEMPSHARTARTVSGPQEAAARELLFVATVGKGLPRRPSRRDEGTRHGGPRRGLRPPGSAGPRRARPAARESPGRVRSGGQAGRPQSRGCGDAARAQGFPRAGGRRLRPAPWRAPAFPPARAAASAPRPPPAGARDRHLLPSRAAAAAATAAAAAARAGRAGRGVNGGRGQMMEACPGRGGGGGCLGGGASARPSRFPRSPG